MSGDDPTTATSGATSGAATAPCTGPAAELQRLQAGPADEPARDPTPNPTPARTQARPPANGFDLLRDAIAAGKKIPGPHNPERYLSGDVPTGNHFDLDLAIAPARPAVASTAPGRPQGPARGPEPGKHRY